MDGGTNESFAGKNRRREGNDDGEVFVSFCGSSRFETKKGGVATSSLSPPLSLEIPAAIIGRGPFGRLQASWLACGDYPASSGDRRGKSPDEGQRRVVLSARA